MFDFTFMVHLNQFDSSQNKNYLFHLGNLTRSPLDWTHYNDQRYLRHLINFGSFVSNQIGSIEPLRFVQLGCYVVASRLDWIECD
jgi:hypothetical protein